MGEHNFEIDPNNVNQIIEKGVVYNRSNNNGSPDGAFNETEIKTYKGAYQAQGLKAISRKVPGPKLSEEEEEALDKSKAPKPEPRYYLYHAPAQIVPTNQVFKQTEGKDAE